VLPRRPKRDDMNSGNSPRDLDNLGGLIRRPAVQMLLVVAAGVQVIAVQQQSARVASTDAIMEAVVVDAPIRRPAVIDEAVLVEQLTASYRAQGYNLSRDLAQRIHMAAAEHGIEPEVAFGLVRAESSFRTSATSVVGAVGLMQLMPATARWLQPGITRAQMRDTDTNLQLGFRYLSQLIDKYNGDVDLALVAYNRGPGTVDRALRRGANPDNGYAAFVRGEKNHGHKLFTNQR
jgi:soluble lytic murein transglycosylase-like protein